MSASFPGPDRLPRADPASPRCEALIAQLNLEPHPEGGWFREVHRSEVQVQRPDGAFRCALTQILYLLPAGGISRWHRLRGADETWLFVAGAPLELWQLPPQGGRATGIRLGHLAAQDAAADASAGQELDSPRSLAVVPADWWQAARSPGGWSLVSCAVGPGFDFEDFQLLAELPPEQHPAGAQVDLL